MKGELKFPPFDVVGTELKTGKGEQPRLEQVRSWGHPSSRLTRGTVELCNSQKSKPTKTMTSGSSRKKHMATWWVPFLVSVRRIWGLLNRISHRESLGWPVPRKDQCSSYFTYWLWQNAQQWQQRLKHLFWFTVWAKYGPGLRSNILRAGITGHTAMHDFLHGCGDPNTGSHAYRGKIFTRLRVLSMP